MVSAVTNSAVVASLSQYQSAGFDGGNSNTKLVISGTEVRCPAYLLPIHSELLSFPFPKNGGTFEYVSGDRSDLVGQTWMAGYPAYQASPVGCLRVVDDRNGKIAFGLQTLLGAIATLPHRDFWRLNLVASIQDCQTSGVQLKNALKGGHNVKFNGENRLSTVDVSVLNVMEEGAGAMVLHNSDIDPDSQTLIFDLGSGTTILSVFGTRGKLIDRTVIPSGTTSLIERIAKHAGMRDQLKQQGDRHLIIEAIENGTFAYGRSGGFDFRAIYDEALVPWVQSTLAPALAAASQWMLSSSTIVAIGGGSQLPTITQFLSAKGITPLPGGGWANARGLELIAIAMGANK